MNGWFLMHSPFAAQPAHAAACSVASSQCDVGYSVSVETRRPSACRGREGGSAAAALPNQAGPSWPGRCHPKPPAEVLPS